MSTRTAPLVEDSTAAALERHVARLRRCRRCPRMIGPVVAPPPVVSPILLVGQAPGPHEGAAGRPFAWTAGKTLFRWFGSIGVDERTFRAGAYMAAVCRCFPGKGPGGGDRVPARDEIERCGGWLAREIELLGPRLVLAVGRLAIERFLPPAPLDTLVGEVHRVRASGHACDVLPLPHPSGASTWFKREPGRSLLERALARLAARPEWRRLRAS